MKITNVTRVDVVDQRHSRRHMHAYKAVGDNITVVVAEMQSNSGERIIKVFLNDG